ncbi:MAG: glycoside hydrolase family 1 protein [Candidatus Moranbacteria bacterium]|nr:glycoside hydrolase family 1 protein [Candidatus Moranbacteria bacterium]
MEKKILKFPEGFLWGAGTSSHQVEGNVDNDWAEWEFANARRKMEEAKKKNWPGFILDNYPNPLQEENYISGRACDHYNRYEEDFDIAASLRHNAHKFSIEWSRIEPEEGKFNDKELEHYARVIRSLKDRGIEPLVVLWHWGNPKWIAKIGAWENKRTVDYYVRYVNRFIKFPGIGDSVKFWMPLNEFQAYIGYSYLGGILPPQKKSLYKANRVLKNLVTAQKKAYGLIHKVAARDVLVGASHHATHHTPYNPKNFLNVLFVKLLDYIKKDRIIKMIGSCQDFIGLQVYRHERLRFSLGGRYGIARIDNEKTDHSDMGWEIYPEGIYHTLKYLKKFDLPIYITENGIADARDKKRTKFINGHLCWIHKAIQEGADVKGYFYWSLMDNLELAEGFWPRFGLVEVDYETMERKIRPSAREYAKICKNNCLET